MSEQHAATTGSGWKGTSTLDLSNENIMTAIQNWLDGNFAPGCAPKAVSIAYDYSKKSFLIQLNGNEVES